MVALEPASASSRSTCLLVTDSVNVSWSGTTVASPVPDHPQRPFVGLTTAGSGRLVVSVGRLPLV